MNTRNQKLTLTLHNPPFKVSNLSSLFRSLQAAVRETAAAGDPVETLFSNQEGPFLVSEVSAEIQRRVGPVDVVRRSQQCSFG